MCASIPSCPTPAATVPALLLLHTSQRLVLLLLSMAAMVCNGSQQNAMQLGSEKQAVRDTCTAHGQHESFSTTAAAECNKGGPCLGFLAELTADG